MNIKLFANAISKCTPHTYRTFEWCRQRQIIIKPVAMMLCLWHFSAYPLSHAPHDLVSMAATSAWDGSATSNWISKCEAKTHSNLCTVYKFVHAWTWYEWNETVNTYYIILRSIEYNIPYLFVYLSNMFSILFFSLASNRMYAFVWVQYSFGIR